MHDFTLVCRPPEIVCLNVAQFESPTAIIFTSSPAFRFAARVSLPQRIYINGSVRLAWFLDKFGLIRPPLCTLLGVVMVEVT